MPARLLLVSHLLIIGWILLFTSAARAGSNPAASADPEHVVAMYYRAISDKDADLFRSLYADTSRNRFLPQRLQQRFAAIEFVEIVRYLGVQTDVDMAHVAVTVKVKTANDPWEEYNFAHHDLKRIEGRWVFIAADELADAERARLTALWMRQKNRMRTEPDLLRHIEQVQASRQQLRERRQPRLVQPVAQEGRELSE